MNTATVIALVSSPLAPVVVGIIGSALEKLGQALKWPRLEALGKALEALALDLPKVLANLKQIGTGKAAK